jgi:hypothetical protein
MIAEWDPKAKKYREVGTRGKKHVRRQWTLLELVTEAERHPSFRFDGQVATW